MKSQPFFVLKTKLLPCSTVVRNLICSQISDEDAPADRSFVIRNVPPLINEKNLLKAFANISPVQSVTFLDSKRNLFSDQMDFGYKKAIVTFSEPCGLEKVLKEQYESPILLAIPLTDARLMTPMQILADQIKNHSRNMDELKKKADEITRLYDEEVRVKEKVIKSSAGEVDEEGWQVVRRSRPDSLNRDKAEKARIKAKEEKRKRLEANVAQVYQYKIRNEKLSKLRELRLKFEADKFKLAQMKSGRKFKPN